MSGEETLAVLRAIHAGELRYQASTAGYVNSGVQVWPGRAVLIDGLLAEALIVSGDVHDGAHPIHLTEAGQDLLDLLARLPRYDGMTRDQIARYLYIHDADEGGPSDWQHLGAQEWDDGLATDDDVASCNARADLILAARRRP